MNDSPSVDLAWKRFFESAKACRDCAKYEMVNVLEGLSADDPWGLPWYDRYHNLDGGLMLVGMDFGNLTTVSDLRQQCSLDPGFEPGYKQDQSYYNLHRFLAAAGLADKAFVTNAALCVRPPEAPESGEMDDAVYTACLRHLKAQIELARPYVIVPLGGDALSWVGAALEMPTWGGIMQVIGQARTVAVRAASVDVMPVLHPRQGQRG